MWKTILNLLFPIHCLGCGQEGDFICFNCFEKLPLNNKPLLNNLLIASYYKHPLLKQAIHRYKYDFVKDLSKPLGQLMIKKLLSFPEFDILKSRPCLIPIPLHKKRLRWRGFNQAELLAQQISHELNIPVINNLLIRTKHTLPQVKIQNAQQRKQNIKHVFELNKYKRPRLRKMDRHGLKEQHPSQYSAEVVRERPCLVRFLQGTAPDYFKNKTLILIDDVSTTGATLEQASQALRLLKPKQIWGLVLAKD